MRLLCWCSRPALTWYPLKLHSWNNLTPFNERHELTVHLRVCTSITSTLQLHTPIKPESNHLGSPDAPSSRSR